MTETLQVEPLDPGVVAALATVSTATITMQLLKRGIRRVWIAGTRPLDPQTPRIAGEAFTVRFVPMREDIATPDSYAKAISIRDAIEAMPAGRVMVIDARGELGCGTLGDILAARIKARGGVAVVSDGAMRDTAEIRAIGLPIFCAGVAAPPSITALFYADCDLPIGCGGVAVIPGDVIVADDDGAVVVPRALASEVARAAPEQELFERFVQLKVAGGAPVVGLYPPNEATLAAYQAWLDQGKPDTSD